MLHMNKCKSIPKAEWLNLASIYPGRYSQIDAVDPELQERWRLDEEANPSSSSSSQLSQVQPVDASLTDVVTAPSVGAASSDVVEHLTIEDDKVRLVSMTLTCLTQEDLRSSQLEPAEQGDAQQKSRKVRSI